MVVKISEAMSPVGLAPIDQMSSDEESEAQCVPVVSSSSDQKSQWSVVVLAASSVSCKTVSKVCPCLAFNVASADRGHFLLVDWCTGVPFHQDDCVVSVACSGHNSCACTCCQMILLFDVRAFAISMKHTMSPS